LQLTVNFDANFPENIGMVPYYRQEEESYHKPSLWSRSICPTSRFMFHVTGIRSVFFSLPSPFQEHTCLPIILF